MTEITICENFVRRKLKAINPNKSAGPDDIAPKLLKLAEPAIVSPFGGSILIQRSPRRNLYRLEEGSFDSSV